MIIRPGGYNATVKDEPKSLGQLFTDSKEYKSRNGRFSDNDSVAVEVKATILSGSLTAPMPRPDLFLPLLQPALDILALIPSVQTTVAAIIYWQETAFTNAAAFITEGTLKPESAKTFQQQTAVVSKVAHWIPVTTEALADAPYVRGIIDTNLRYGVRKKIEQEVLVGSGTAPDLRGIDNTTGIHKVPFRTDIATSIMDGIQLVETSLGVPSAIVMNPADWATVRLTTGGMPYAYLWGPPTEKGVMSMWGLPVVATVACPQGFAYVADWSQAMLLVREDVNIFTGLKNDDLIKNILTIVCEARVGFVVMRPPTFSKIGLDATHIP